MCDNDRKRDLKYQQKEREVLCKDKTLNKDQNSKEHQQSQALVEKPEIIDLDGQEEVTFIEVDILDSQVPKVKGDEEGQSIMIELQSKKGEEIGQIDKQVQDWWLKKFSKSKYHCIVVTKDNQNKWKEDFRNSSKEIKRNEAQEERYPLIYSGQQKEILCLQNNPSLIYENYNLYEPFSVYLAARKSEEFYKKYKKIFESSLKINQSLFSGQAILTNNASLIQNENGRARIEGDLPNFEQTIRLIRDRADKEQCFELQKQLLDNIWYLGGPEKCFSIEKKTRTFLDKVFEHVIKQINSEQSQKKISVLDLDCSQHSPCSESNLSQLLPMTNSSSNPSKPRQMEVYMDFEVELNLFGEMIKPDYVIFLNRANQQFNQIRKNESKIDMPLLVVEAKRAQNSRGKSLIQEIDQHFKQLRYVCIRYKLTYALGVLTDMQTWYFTKCDFNKEVSAATRNNQQTSAQVFHVSDPIHVMTLSEQCELINGDVSLGPFFKIDQEKLAQVCQVIQEMAQRKTKEEDFLWHNFD